MHEGVSKRFPLLSLVREKYWKQWDAGGTACPSREYGVLLRTCAKKTTKPGANQAGAVTPRLSYLGSYVSFPAPRSITRPAFTAGLLISCPMPSPSRELARDQELSLAPTSRPADAVAPNEINGHIKP